MTTVEDVKQELIEYANISEQEWWEESGKQTRAEWEEKQRKGEIRSSYTGWYYQPKKEPDTYERIDNGSMRHISSLIEYSGGVGPHGRTYDNVDVVGGENCGPIFSIIFKVDDELFELTGSYDSQEGIDWGWPELSKVKPVEKTITVYERM